MKIIQIIPFFGMGGAEIMCENLIYELKGFGHEVIAVSLYTKKTPISKRLELAHVDIRYLDKKEGLDFSMFEKLKKLFKHEKPDAVHTHIYAAKYVFPVATRLKIKAVHTVHSIATQESGKLSRIFNKYFFAYFDVVPVALSANVQKTIMDEYKLRVEKVPIVLNGIDLKRCNPKQSYKFTDKFKIVHVGSFLDVKNHRGLLEAFEIFNRKYPNSELHLIGEGRNRREIEDLVEAKKMSRCVIFVEYGFIYVAVLV